MSALKKVPKVYVESRQLCLENVFRDLGWKIVDVPTQAADFIVLMGGADINPFWYKQAKHSLTHRTDHSFDHMTATLAEFALMNNKNLIGICRGAQFINAISGGSMYQHVDNHHRHHDLIDLQSGQKYRVNSIHHQMMIPHESAEIVAVADGPVAMHLHYMEGSEEKMKVNTGDEPEVEALFYRETKALCFQAHPEYATLNSPTRLYFYELMKRYYPEYFEE